MLTTARIPSLKYPKSLDRLTWLNLDQEKLWLFKIRVVLLVKVFKMYNFPVYYLQKSEWQIFCQILLNKFLYSILYTYDLE